MPKDYLLLIRNSNLTGALLTRPESGAPGTRLQILCAVWIMGNQVPLQPSVFSSIRWDKDRKLHYKAGPSSSKTRLWVAIGICTSRPALPSIATRGQQHLVLEALLWVGCCD